MNVQNVFNKVIDSGYYHSYPLMCHAVASCFSAGVVTKEEYYLVSGEIKSYLKGYGSLAGALDNRGLPWDFESRLSIYQDWANKPSLEK